MTLIFECAHCGAEDPSRFLEITQGPRKGIWAVTVSGNWRVTFGFAGKDAERVDYEDYH